MVVGPSPAATTSISMTFMGGIQQVSTHKLELEKTVETRLVNVQISVNVHFSRHRLPKPLAKLRVLRSGPSLHDFPHSSTHNDHGWRGAAAGTNAGRG